ncbi:MAG: hypothetical protein QOI13_389 [Paraburkholderia sp.]|nr:hypothetical protein [Paraburkholderia sp.]
MVGVSSDKVTKKAARMPKQANGHAAAHAGAAPATSALHGGQRAKAPKNARATNGGSVAAALTQPEKVKRAKKEKVVRDSFTMPKSDYEKLAKLKQKCLDAGIAAKKSELLRAGLLMLDSAPVKRMLATMSAIETVKTGRPAKS